MNSSVVVLDACTLYPAALRDDLDTTGSSPTHPRPLDGCHPDEWIAESHRVSGIGEAERTATKNGTMESRHGRWLGSWVDENGGKACGF